MEDSRFSIRFEDGHAFCGENEASAVVELGDFSEGMAVPLAYWTQADYARHWRESASNVVESDGSAVAFLAALYDPRNADFAIWWLAYRSGPSIRVFQQVHFFEPNRPSTVDELLARVPTLTELTEHEDGEPEPSEWSVSVSAVRRYLANVS